MSLRIASVTVNTNGGELPLRQYRVLRAQTRPIDEIILVDNGSTDGSRELLARQSPGPTILALPENLGVGGGFSAGLRHALESGHDWIWLFDEDSQPEPDALEQLLRAYEALQPSHNIGILSCLPVHRETGAEYHGLQWKNRFSRVADRITRAGDYFADSVISSGCLVSAEAVRHMGYPRADYFMDFVDHEFNLRLRRGGYEIAVIRNSVLQHSIGRPRRVTIGPITWVRPQQPTWRLYYIVRNHTSTVWHDLSGFRSRAFLIGSLIKAAVAILMFDPDKSSRLKSIFLGFRDGVKNRLGRTYLASSFAQRSKA
jgi:GT2 family glycosyltransferase